MKLNNLEKGYVAGILDGEGSIGIHFVKATKTSSDGLRPRIEITNKNLEVLKWIKNKTGCGRIEYVKRTIKSKECYRYVLTTPNKIKELLTIVSPFMIIKKVHAELMIEFLNNRTLRLPFKGHEFKKGEKILISEYDLKTYEKMKQLNKPKIINQG